ncbi:hypothetical protein [Pseudomonas brassicacearum]|uniref:Lipoprotein n=1 Tax=Pseudomonas brassicacearum TaxID=930166 RepID=A0A423GIL5_9PSED|nr:hypothetical protein [Pseudomonas brassicacearum]ROM89398.1 hypothetical protein BK658_28210 [Pseudomonas brassicacearum]
MIYRLALAAGIAALSGCAALHSTNECEANFSSEGSIVTGKKFSTTSMLPSISPNLAFQRLSAVMLEEGFHIESSDPHRGLISAYQDVNYSSKRAPLNAIVEAASSGTKVTLVFVVAAGIYAPDIGARGEFCKIINAVNAN